MIFMCFHKLVICELKYSRDFLDWYFALADWTDQDGARRNYDATVFCVGSAEGDLSFSFGGAGVVNREYVHSSSEVNFLFSVKKTFWENTDILLPRGKRLGPGPFYSSPFSGQERIPDSDDVRFSFPFLYNSDIA